MPLLSGAESFTFVRTLDAEFYLNLGAFGSEVTDRAPEVMRYSTKSGINPLNPLGQGAD